MSKTPIKLLIAASGTGGHLFPALAVAEKLPDNQIEWLGVPNRLETSLVPDCYPLHTIQIEGFQDGLSLKTLGILQRFTTSIFQVRKLIQERNIDLIFTTGGYIAAPAILAAWLQKIPVILHESNFIPGKVTSWFGPLCYRVAVGFSGTISYLPRSKNIWVGTPVRTQFRTPQILDLPIPNNIPLIVVVGGSQGAVAINKLVRDCAENLLDTGAFMVHLTGDKDPDINSFQHPHYLPMPFYENMAGLLQRANLAISRSGAGTLTELAITKTPAILIPYPYAAEDHQAYNAKVFADVGAAIIFRQSELTANILENQVLELLLSPPMLQQMTEKTANLAIIDSAEQLVSLIQEAVDS
jgi:UDP-N-acetylglucosamine--N-acetylmuramyl-(pentapeptide) pyrophosphoryl-undecaprenol N-acetylglucosamine transferase